MHCSSARVHIPRAIKRYMGHSSISVTMDIYGHLFPSYAEDLDELYRRSQTDIDRQYGRSKRLRTKESTSETALTRDSLRPRQDSNLRHPV